MSQSANSKDEVQKESEEKKAPQNEKGGGVQSAKSKESTVQKEGEEKRAPRDEKSESAQPAESKDSKDDQSKPPPDKGPDNDKKVEPAAKDAPTGGTEEKVVESKSFFKRRLSKRGSKGNVTDVKKKWTTAVSGVKKSRKQRRQSLVIPENDPFLERFTVTGRAWLEEHAEHEILCEDLFTLKFWSTLVVDPSGLNYYRWSFFIMVSVLYNLLFVLLRAVFEQAQSEEFVPVWLTLDYLGDTIYMMDMFVQSRIGFLEQGLLVKDTKRLTKRYLKSWKFIVDVLSILPLDLFYLLLPGFPSLLRLNRILKTWRFVDFFHMAESHSNNPNLIRIFNLILYIIIIIHWNCCFFIAISRAVGFGDDSWVYPNESDDFWLMYLSSFYWSALTLTTIGDTPFPEQPFEYLFCICDSLIGVLIFATIFGNVGAMINHMDAHRTEFQNKVDNVKRYMDLRQIGPELQNRVIKWFDYTWNNKQSIDDKEALQALPDKLRAEISIHVHMQTLRRVAIFKDCEPGLLVELVLKLKLQVFSPGDYICRKGDIGKEMYIIKRGRLQVVSEDGKKVFVTLSDGAVFGEVSILNIAGNKTGNRRTASVRSVGYSDLFCLSKNDLWDALQEYPEAKKMLSEIGKNILRKDNLLDEEAARREEKRQQAMVTKIEMIVDSVDDISKQLDKLNENMESRSTYPRRISQEIDTIEEEKE